MARESGMGERELKGKLEQCMEALSNFKKLYKTATVAHKHMIAGSIFGGEIIFDGKNCRTRNLNPTVEQIIKTGKGFEEKKTGQGNEISPLSRLVARTGVEPVTSGL